MANYNADIRVGITGKTQLNALEKQLGRINKDLNQINKNLKAQTLTINTKGANRALDQLDRKINKLNRSISVNANVKENRSGGGGGGVAPFGIAVTKQIQTQEKALSKLADTTVEVRGANNKLQQVNQRADKFYGDLNEKIAERNDLLKQQAKDMKDVMDVETSRSAKARTANQNRLFGGQLSKAGKPLSPAQAQGFAEQRIQGAGRRIGRLDREIDATRKKYENLARVQRSFWNQENARVRKATAAWDRYNQRLKDSANIQAKRSKITKGAGAGAGIAAASALSGVPVLGDAVTGGLVAGFSGGSVAAGALAGGIVGLGVAFAGATANVTEFNNALLKQQRALANTVSTSDELEAALAAIERASDDFLVPIGQATEQFTKLNAAARASGFTVEEVEEVYRGLASANTALGGNQERLQGILLATQQVFSKGKVQAEELRGQIGERLAGAFAKFAESAGLSTSQLDKALEKGEVSLEDFVRFAKSLLEDYEEEAKKIADAPENAADRLKLAMDDLRRSMGPILTDIGNQFIEMANTVVVQLTRLFDYINQARTQAARTQAAADRANLQNVRGALKTAEENYQNNPNFLTKFEFDRQSRAVNLAMQNVRRSAKVLTDITQLSLQATADPLKEKTKPDPLDKKTGGGSTSGPRSTLDDTLISLELQKKLLEIEKERTGLIGKNNEMAEFALQQRELEEQLIADLARVELDNLDAASKQAEKTLLQVKYQTDLVALTNERKTLEDEINKEFSERLADLELQIKLEEAITEEERERLRLAAEIKKIEDGPGSPEQKSALIAAQTALKEARDGNQGLPGYVRQLQEELADTDAMLVQMAQTVQGELATAFSSAFTGIIDGSKSAEEALRDMFANIGKAFISMATEIIAKQMVMITLQAILKALGGAPNSGGTPNVDAIESYSGIGANSDVSGLLPRANGGHVGPNAPYMVGERGPEIFVPNQSGRVISNEAMGSYMPNGSSSGGGGTVNVNYSGPQLNFNGDEYLPKSAVGEIINEAALKGARLGEAQTINSMKNKRSTRARAGI